MTWPRTQRPVDVHLTLTTVPMAKRYSPEYWPAMGGARPAVGLPAVPFSASVSGRSGAAAAFFFAAGAFFFYAAAGFFFGFGAALGFFGGFGGGTKALTRVQGRPGPSSAPASRSW